MFPCGIPIPSICNLYLDIIGIQIKFFGKYYPVKARIKSIESLSAHADQNDLMDWMSNIKNIPEHVYLIHGEPTALDAFRVKIKDTYSWDVTIPKLADVEKVIL